MKMKDFIKADSVDEAVSLLGEHGANCALVAGGTDLMVAMHKANLEAEKLIDISSIPELRFVREEGDFIRIGSGMTHTECVKNDIVQKYAPILGEACSWVGSLQIRNRGTVGGNIISAAACADTVPALVALNGKCVLMSSQGSRELLISELITGPNKTVRRPDEICTELIVEKMHLGASYRFLKLIRRNAVAKSRLTVAAIALQEDGRVKDIRISVGSTTPRPRRFTSAEGLFLGRVPDAAMCREAGEKVSAEMIALTGQRWSTEYKKPVAEALTARALREILEV